MKNFAGIAGLCVLTLVGSTAIPAAAAGAGAPVLVTAVVVRYARMKLLLQPVAVVVAPLDINRGYVECAEPTELAVQSNSPDGFLLEFASASEFALKTTVNGLIQPLQIGAAGGASVQPAAAAGATRVLRLAYRFELAPGLQAGTYAWPVRVSLTPL